MINVLRTKNSTLHSKLFFAFLNFKWIKNRFPTCQALNPYLRHVGNVMKRHLWTKNPKSYFWFWWRHTLIKCFYFMLIWNLLSSTNCTPLGLITWRHYPEISCDEHKCTWKPGNMVERHLWTKNPHLFFTRIIFAELFNPYCQISGIWARPFTWKTHPSKNYEYLFSFFKTRVVS